MKFDLSPAFFLDGGEFGGSDMWYVGWVAVMVLWWGRLPERVSKLGVFQVQVFDDTFNVCAFQHIGDSPGRPPGVGSPAVVFFSRRLHPQLIIVRIPYHINCH